MIRLLLAAFFLTVAAFNVMLVPSKNLYLSHVATISLLGVAVLVALARFSPDRWWPREVSGREIAPGLAALILAVLSVSYVSARLIQSAGNPWFFGEAAKLAVLVGGILAFGLLDRGARYLAFYAWLIPTAVAVLVIMHLPGFHPSYLGTRYRFQVESLGSPGMLGYIAGTSFGMLLYWIDRRRSPVRVWFGRTVGAVLVIGVLLSFSRNALVALAVSSLLYLYMGHRLRLRTLLILSAVAALAVVLSLRTLSVTSVLLGRFSLGDVRYLSGRTFIWGQWIRSVTADPMILWFGSGIGSTGIYIPEAKEFLREPHNILLDILANLGVIGVVLYILFLLLLLRRMLLTSRSPTRSIALALFASYCVTDLIDDHWRQSQLLWYTALLFHLFLQVRPRAEEVVGFSLGGGRLLNVVGDQRVANER